MSVPGTDIPRNSFQIQIPLEALEAFHARVSATVRALGRFNSAEFKEKFGSFNPIVYGYRSLEEIFVTRGCQRVGEGIFVYREKPCEHVSDVENLLKSFGPPNFPKNKEFRRKLDLFHCHVTSVLGSLKRFSIEDFVKEVSVFEYPFDPQDFGYSSIEHLLFFRGCYREDSEFVYEKMTAFQRKAAIVAAYLGDFSEFDFRTTFGSFFRDKFAFLAQHGFDSFESLLRTIRCVKSDKKKRGNSRFSVSRRTLCSFHKAVDAMLEDLGKFTKETFIEKMGKLLTLGIFGYASVDELLEMRGCVFDGKEYVYDKIEVYRRMAFIVAEKLGKFTEHDFICTFDYEMNSFPLKRADVFGFVSFSSFFNWMPGLRVVSRNAEPVKYIYFTADVSAEEWTALSAETRGKFSKVLCVARTLDNTFSERNLYNAYRRYYKIEPYEWRTGDRRVPVFLETIPGIEHMGEGIYRLNEGWTGGEEVVEFLLRYSEGEEVEEKKKSEVEIHDERGNYKEEADVSGEEEDSSRDNSVTQYVKEEPERVTAKREHISDSDDSDAECGEPMKKRLRESPPNSFGSGAHIDHDELVTVAVEEGREEVHMNEESASTVKSSATSTDPSGSETRIDSEEVVTSPLEERMEEVAVDSAPSAESPTAPTDPSEANPSPSLYDHILSLGVVRGQWAQEQLTLITGQMEQSIQEQGSSGGIDGPVAAPECSNAPSSEVASSSSAASPQSIHQALTNLIGQFHNQFLYFLSVEAIERGASPSELGKKIMDDFFGKKQQQP